MIKDALSKIAEFNKFGSILGLERMTGLLSRLGNPHKDLKIIHVAGTNGKGSVCRFLSYTLREHGFKTGLYSSPFIEVFNERIECDGKYISDDDLNRIADVVIKAAHDMVADGEPSPTEFDVVTAIAFEYFKDQNVDVVILEVGLGGKGDSTNVVEKPLASVITSISYDHMDRLGNTLELIAADKAGIIKEGCPVIINVDAKSAKDIMINKAEEVNAPLYDIADTEFVINEEGIEGTSFDANILGTEFKDVVISMVGRHQVSNAITALSVLELLHKNGIIKLVDSKLKSGFVKAFNMGRFEVLEKDPYYILDGAHNEAGINAFTWTVNNYLKNKKLLTVVGVLKDKDVEKIATSLVTLGCDFIAIEPDNPRKMDKDDLAKFLSSKGANVLEACDRGDVVSKVRSLEDKYDGILFVGSLYLIGEIRRRLTHGEEEERKGTAVL